MVVGVGWVWGGEFVSGVVKVLELGEELESIVVASGGLELGVSVVVWGGGVVWR